MAAPNLKEIEWAIHELKQEESSKGNYILMASLLRCRDEMLGVSPEPQIAAYSQAAPPVPVSATLDIYGDSDFLRTVSGKDPADAWAVMDGHMENLRAVNPRAYEGVMERLRRI